MAKRKLITPLFLLSSFLLIGCSSDTIVARPTWIDEKIFATAGDKDNKFKNIYDAVKNLGDTNSSVLNNVMYKIAQDQLGTYTELLDYSDETKFNADPGRIDNFVNSHKIYQSEDYGVIKGQDAAKTLGVKEKRKVSFNKIKDQYDQMIEDIYETLYNDIKGGSYSEDNYFSEKKFIMHLRKELYTTNTSYDINTDTLTFTKNDGTILTFSDENNKILVNKTQKFENSAKTGFENLTWKMYVDIETDTDPASKPTKFGFLHVTTAGQKVEEKVQYIYHDYIERKILPELYKTYLTQTYVTQQRYSSLGRSYARKVSMITIPHNTDYDARILSLMNIYAEAYITGNDSKKPIELNYDFELLADAMRGFVGTAKSTTSNPNAYDLLESAKFAKISAKITGTENQTPIIWESRLTGKTTYVYSGTKLGELVNKVKQCCDIEMDKEGGKSTISEKTRTPDQETIYKDITKNYTYDLETGIKMKEIEAYNTDYTKDGWFLKNGGLTELNATYRDNLFNISSSNIIDNEKKITGDTWVSDDYVRYFGKINGEDLSNRQAFLTTETTSTEPYKTIVINDKTNYYIIAVDEAINSAKVSLAKNKGSYSRIKATADDAADGVIAQNKLVKQIVKANSSSDTYKKNANEYYLMISNIVFYDQSVYDYFKSQFPDLFK